MQNLEPLKELLESFWLENNEAITYLEALKLWTSPASSIANKVWVSRTSIRYTCEVLVKKWLMIASKKWNTKLFTSETPNKLKNLLILEKNKLEIKEKKLSDNFSDLLNLYNPYTKVPKMTFYEWEEWAKKILSDHLKEDIQIYSFIDMDWIVNFFWKIQDWYTKKRIKLNINKKVIFSSTKELNNKFNTSHKNIVSNWFNQTKYIKWKSLYVASYLYDWKFSYITLRKWKFFWIIIEDEDFYNYHKSIFDFMWEHASDNLET